MERIVMLPTFIDTHMPYIPLGLYESQYILDSELFEYWIIEYGGSMARVHLIALEVWGYDLYRKYYPI